MKDVERYEIENPAIKATLRDIAQKIGSALPAGWGFLLHLFEFGTEDNPGATFYISNADRADAVRMLRAWIAKQEPSIDGEVNPDHPMTLGVRQQWHKIVALLLMRSGPASFSSDDFAALGAANVAVAVDDHHDTLNVRLVSAAEAQRLAAAEQQEGR